MSEFESYIKKALKDLKYSSPDTTRREVVEVCKEWRGLKPSTNDYVFGNGQRKTLLSLSGTIPISFKGAYYHTPVEIFLLDTYPNNAPLVYVRPTPQMRIKVSRHVDTNGKVYLPFLHSWRSDSGLAALIQVLICLFGEQPPVFAVPNPTPAQPMPPTSISNVPYPIHQTPYPPYPMPMPGLSATPQLPTQNSSTSTVSPVHIRASLLSAVGDKLRTRLEDIYFSTEIEMKTGEQLKEGMKKLEELEKQLNEEKVAAEKVFNTCQNEIQQLDEKIQKYSNQETPDILDDAIQAPAPLYKQIVSTFAEDAALEDTIYYLSEGFRSGKLDIELFQKHLRILSRKQFMLRAMLRKCRQKAGLAG